MSLIFHIQSKVLAAFLIGCMWTFGQHAHAQISYPDTSRWIGQWADEGDLTYSMEGFIVVQENGDAKGWFDWTMIYSPYQDHRYLIGHTGRELFEGKYHKLSGMLRLQNEGIVQKFPVISGDNYVIQLVNHGEKMLGQNFNPLNYQGSLYALRVPKLSPVPPPPVPYAMARSGKTLGKKKETVKRKEKPKPTKKANAAPEKPAEVETPEAELEANLAQEDSLPDFSDRTVLTKDEMAVAASEVRIEIWDKSLEDGDIVSLELNGKRILSSYRVRSRKKRLKLKLEKGENLLIMHAENLGRVPPNTAAISVYQGKNVQTYILNSDLGKSEAIRLIQE